MARRTSSEVLNCVMSMLPVSDTAMVTHRKSRCIVIRGRETEMATSNDQQGGERRNGHRPRAETLPRADVSSAETADGLMAGARVTDVAPHSEGDGQEPHLNSAESDGLTRASANGSRSTLAESLDGVRERLGLPKREWPVEAERNSERRKYKQAMAVELLASGMTHGLRQRAGGPSRRCHPLRRWPAGLPVHGCAEAHR